MAQLEGKLPLKNSRHEQYCISRAAGRNQGDSWSDTFPKGSAIPSSDSLKVSGNRVEKKVQVQQRIQFLTLQQREIEYAENMDVEDVQNFQRADIVKLSLEITQALESALENALRSTVSPVRISQLKNTLSNHLQRQTKLSENEVGGEEMDRDSVPVGDAFSKVGVCVC